MAAIINGGRLITPFIHSSNQSQRDSSSFVVKNTLSVIQIALGRHMMECPACRKISVPGGEILGFHSMGFLPDLRCVEWFLGGLLHEKIAIAMFLQNEWAFMEEEYASLRKEMNQIIRQIVSQDILKRTDYPQLK